MTKFDISSNEIRAEGGRALAAGLKGNQVITELNISSNRLGHDSAGYGDTSGVIAIANAIPDMGALSSLTFSGERYYNGEDLIEDDVTITTATTDADFSGKHLGSSGGIILAAWLSRNKGALSKLDLRDNNIPSAEKALLQGTCDANEVALGL
jgi:hypothetical protein